MSKQTIELDGTSYVIVPKKDYEAMEALARMPALPDPLPNGNYPAAEYMRVSIARDIIADRVKLGWSQAELARRAGIRAETLCRIESGKVSPNIATVDKIDRALREAEAANGKRAGKQRAKKR